MKIRHTVTVLATVLALVFSGATADAGPEKGKKDKTEKVDRGSDKAKKNIPDNNDKGPERDEGDGQPPNGDHNHGCGGEPDRSDDNEGWCGQKPKKDKEPKTPKTTVPKKGKTPKTTVPTVPTTTVPSTTVPEVVTTTTTSTTLATTTTVPSTTTTVPTGDDVPTDEPVVPEGPEDDDPDSPVIVRTVSVAPTLPTAAVTQKNEISPARSEVRARQSGSLPKTGGDLLLLPFALGAVAIGKVLTSVTKGRRRP